MASLKYRNHRKYHVMYLQDCFLGDPARWVVIGDTSSAKRAREVYFRLLKSHGVERVRLLEHAKKGVYVYLEDLYGFLGAA
jgi:hypothetical protein